MEFIHQPYQPNETITAIATPPGEGGVAIVRISGAEAIPIANSIFSGDITTYKTHTAHYGKVIDQNKNTVDHVLLLVMLGPRSYTGEDTVEIHCHGGSLITRRVLDTVIHAGARAARPGEFTFKAFINGKIDLAQAEAVQELVAAKNTYALDAAENQLQGKLSSKIQEYQREITEIAAILEAWVDFPDEDLEFASLEEVCEKLESACGKMRQLENTYHNGKIIHEGISLCLVGSPNVGKSSLMNALLDKERAIVTPIPGTTRDILEDDLRLDGLHFKLIDTAGIRENPEMIEQEGIRRSKEALSRADLVLLMMDASRELDRQDQDLIQLVPKGNTIAIWNKTDLPCQTPPSLNFPNTVSISAKKKTGLDKLQKTITNHIWENGPPSKEEILLTNVRHKEAISQAILSCEKVIQGLQINTSPEFLSLDIRHCLLNLGKVIGTNIGEDILSAIFSKFCIGK